MYYALLGGLAVLLLVHLLRTALHPGVASIPGPFVAKFTDLWRLYKLWQWTFKQDLPALHDKYNSPLLRIGPKLLSCSDPRAVDLIYGFHSDFKKSDMVKAMAPVYQGKKQPTMFSAADNKTHARIRRPVAPAYAMSRVIQVSLSKSPTHGVRLTQAQFEPFVNNNTKTLYTKLDELFIRRREPCPIHHWVQYCMR